MCPHPPHPFTGIKTSQHRFPRAAASGPFITAGAGTDAIILVIACPRPPASGRSSRPRRQDPPPGAKGEGWGLAAVPHAPQTYSAGPQAQARAPGEGGEAQRPSQRWGAPPPGVRLGSDHTPDVRPGRVSLSGPQWAACSGEGRLRTEAASGQQSTCPSPLPADGPLCTHAATDTHVRGSELGTQGGTMGWGRGGPTGSGHDPCPPLSLRLWPHWPPL